MSKVTTGRIHKVKKPHERARKAPSNSSLSSISISEAFRVRRVRDIKAYAEFVIETIRETLALHVTSIFRKMEAEQAEASPAQESSLNTQEVLQLNKIVEQFLNMDFACDIPLEGRLTGPPQSVAQDGGMKLEKEEDNEHHAFTIIAQELQTTSLSP
ncbi:hypothetical protein MMC30_002685 [Trapelia coarctata]|nr:hypothetical protein [Trapelia coarctata]